VRFLVFCVGLVSLNATGCSQPPTTENAPATSTTPRASQSADWAPERVDQPHLPNAYRLDEKVISGGQPEGEAAFRELQDLGVKTVISVDGAKPDVELAEKYGIRYVHIPFGYDGVPEEQGRELAKVVRDLPGPIYIHCHHGKHRSPAGAVVACVGAGLLEPDNALVVLQTAGTSQHYRGLYQSAESARRIESAMLDELETDFPATVDLPPLAEAMVALEHTHDHLLKIEAAGWRSPPEHPDLAPSHEALLLREHFTELLRSDEAGEYPKEFRELLRDSEAAALELETGLSDFTETTEPAPSTIAKSFARITNNCKTCHAEYRDNPQ
jgi:protein tyrosine phosphatase (PTP) superfamily phosphohydrolase (DUF442 family)